MTIISALLRKTNIPNYSLVILSRFDTRQRNRERIMMKPARHANSPYKCALCMYRPSWPSNNHSFRL